MAILGIVSKDRKDNRSNETRKNDVVGLYFVKKKLDTWLLLNKVTVFSKGVAVIGGSGSGKSLFSRYVMQKAGISDYKVFDASVLESSEKISVAILDCIRSGCCAFLFEDTDRASSDVLQTIYNLAKGEVTDYRTYERFIYEDLFVVCTMKDICPELLGGILFPIHLTYHSPQDYTELYLKFCDDFGVDLKNNLVNIDNRAVTLLGSMVRDDIRRFRNACLYIQAQSFCNETPLRITTENLMNYLPPAF